jgi:UDP-3-O-[3-hydroxymyristoyl] glucosamine N-acyltransferase
MEPNYYESGVRNVVFGSNVKIVRPVNLYGCEIGENCSIGPFVEIQKSVTIGSNTKVQSHTFICELVDIGSNCFIGHGVMFINDVLEKLDKVKVFSPSKPTLSIKYK